MRPRIRVRAKNRASLKPAKCRSATRADTCCGEDGEQEKHAKHQRIGMSSYQSYR